MSLERLGKLIKQLKRLDIEKLTLEVVEENRALLEDFNTLQLKEGLRADGSDITPEYSPFTIEQKKIKGQPYDRVTLKDEGNWWESIKLKVSRKDITYVATDKKTEDLIEKYGKDILGLSDDDKTEFIESYLTERLQEKIRKHLDV